MLERDELRRFDFQYLQELSMVFCLIDRATLRTQNSQNNYPRCIKITLIENR